MTTGARFLAGARFRLPKSSDEVGRIKMCNATVTRGVMSALHYVIYACHCTEVNVRFCVIPATITHSTPLSIFHRPRLPSTTFSTVKCPSVSVCSAGSASHGRLSLMTGRASFYPYYLGAIGSGAR